MALSEKDVRGIASTQRSALTDDELTQMTSTRVTPSDARARLAI